MKISSPPLKRKMRGAAGTWSASITMRSPSSIAAGKGVQRGRGETVRACSILRREVEGREGLIEGRKARWREGRLEREVGDRTREREREGTRW